jgi:aryl-alcohol dehydrogenase-like predicted oxidoreductase
VSHLEIEPEGRDANRGLFFGFYLVERCQRRCASVGPLKQTDDACDLTRIQFAGETRLDMRFFCNAGCVGLLQRRGTSIFIASDGKGKHMQNHKFPVQRNEAPAKKSGEFLIGGDLRVTRLGFGAMRITGDGIWGQPADRAEAVRVLRRAVELGINFIDTADSYGPGVSEEIIAEALYPYSKGVVIATKGGFDRPGPDIWVENGKPEHLKSACEGSLRRLRLDRIDLYQLHRIDPKVPAEDQLGTLKDLQAQGKIKHIGLSEVSVRQIQHARTIVPIVSVQNRYSVTDRGSEDVLEYCEKEKMGFIPWFPLAAGRVSGPESPISRMAARWKVTPSQLALAWLLARSPAMLPIPGTSRVEHLEENVAAAELKIDRKQWQELDRMARAS